MIDRGHINRSVPISGSLNKNGKVKARPIERLSVQSRKNFNTLSSSAKGFVNDYIKLTGKVPVITSGRRDKDSGVGNGGFSWHTEGNAIDFRVGTIDMDWLMNTKEGLELQRKYGFGALDETNPLITAKTGVTGKHIHIGKDSKWSGLVNTRLKNFGTDKFKTYYTYNQMENNYMSKYSPDPTNFYVTSPWAIAKNKNTKETNEKDFGEPPVTEGKDKEEVGYTKKDLQDAVKQAMFERERKKEKARKKLAEETAKKKAEMLRKQKILAMYNSPEKTVAQEYNDKMYNRKQTQPIRTPQPIQVQQGFDNIESLI